MIRNERFFLICFLGKYVELTELYFYLIFNGYFGNILILHLFIKMLILNYENMMKKMI